MIDNETDSDSEEFRDLIHNSYKALKLTKKSYSSFKHQIKNGSCMKHSALVGSLYSIAGIALNFGCLYHCSYVSTKHRCNVATCCIYNLYRQERTSQDTTLAYNM